MQTSATRPDSTNKPIPVIEALHMDIPAIREKLADVAEMIDAYAGQAGWTQEVTTDIDLVLEELLINIIDYGYPDRPAGQIQLTVESLEDRVCIHLVDDGVAFDPLQYEISDPTLPLEDRTLGGLGLLLVKSLTNSWNYQFRQGCNHTTLIRHI